MATLNETRALTSRTSEVAQDMSIPKSRQKYKFLRSQSSVYFVIIASKIVNLLKFVCLLKKLLVTTLIETPEFTSGNYEVY